MEKDYVALLKGENYEFIGGKENKKTGTITLGYYKYAPHVFEVIKQVLGEEIIANYVEFIKDIEKKEISELSLQEVKTYFTAIDRGERFCDGHIANYLNKGIFLKLYERYLELC